MSAETARERIQKLLVTGDNRLKQGVAPEKVRETYEEALRIARRQIPFRVVVVREMASLEELHAKPF